MTAVLLRSLPVSISFSYLKGPKIKLTAGYPAAIIYK